MRKKTLICGVLAASVTLAASLGGCSLISTNSSADMEQVIATVDISKSADFDKEFGDYKTQFNEVVGETKVIKRELISYFLNVGYSYIQNGSSYKEVFNMLVDTLVNNAVLTQYSTMYLLKDMGAEAFEEFKALETTTAKYEYILGGADSDDVKVAKYSLYSSLNAAIDSQEERILEKDDSSSGSDTRTAPGGVDTEKEDYYPASATSESGIDYNVYTGYDKNLLKDSGIYKEDAIEGTTRATRIRAYNKFISSLISYNLVNAEKEDLRDIYSLKYIENEYINQLKSRIINRYYETYEDDQEAALTNENYKYVQSVYDDLKKWQQNNFKEDGFSTSVGEMSDSSFILYSPDTENGGKFGFVYNILLPFSASQSANLTALQNNFKDEDVDSGYSHEYYFARNQMLKKVETTDQRSAWFNGETEYAFKAEDLDYFGKTPQNDGWLFFENNIKNSDRYENLEKYDGRYAYNGTVEKKEDGKYVLLAEKLGIDAMLSEFSGYVDYVLGSSGNVTFVADENNVTYTLGQENAKYYEYTGEEFYKSGKNDDDKFEIDYSKFIYALGRVGNFAASDRGNLLVNKTEDNDASEQYKALSAVNELQYAYTTDTSVLSQYLGYTVEAGDTSYVKEFEYAAHLAINQGAGSFAVCAADFGWHLIYVTYTFDLDADQYNPQWSNIKIEGTFENLFYESIKDTAMKDVSSVRRNWIVNKFSKEDVTVVKHQNRYQDLLDLDNN